ncbi:class I SAM-dependent RNA methyltransferase [Sphingomonas naphthae]|uniref:Class I SAM-dependent RNA methyltransferase n=1 Tax=Sphingomonas naphthae TaxID=1813468 RepID=A0ABY7TGL1_9SPHN|nr:class I SAM-dependent RNA methyltransferase [Sphingomonas naphthae]WCT71978.1 class I SAM-dependent RNA methyltransferase [Sphingomonas naphthae]
MTAELIVRIASRGDGITADGRKSPQAAPGDWLELDGSVTPGPHHVDPPCRHFPTCGGCQLMHVDDESYGGFAVDKIVGALRQQGIEPPEMAPIHLSPPRTRRRAALSIERKGRVVRVGFHEEASHRIVDMAECHILAPELFALVAPLRQLMARLLPDRGTATAQMTLTDSGVDLALEGMAAPGLEQSEALTMFAEGHGLARLSIDEGFGPETRWEPDAVTVTLGGVKVPLSAGAFLQATADGEAALVAAVIDAIGDAPTIADLFAGLGTFTLPLAARAKVYAAEGARDPMLALKGAAMQAGRAVFPEHRDLFRRPLSTSELDRFAAIVLDPPRAGAREQVATLAASTASRLAYVSCNPATFARDARALIAGGWRLDWIRPVGQFRWSTHVELASRFSR